MASTIFLGSDWITVPANKLTLKDVRDSLNRQGGFLRPRSTGQGNVPLSFDIALPAEVVPEGTFDFLNSSPNETHSATTLVKDIKLDHLLHQKQIELDPNVKVWAEQEKVLDLLPLLLASGFISLDVIATIEKPDLEAIGISRLGDQKRLLLAKSRAHPGSPTPTSADPFYPAASAVLASFFETPKSGGIPASPNGRAPITPDTDTQIKIFKDLTKTQAPRRCKSNCHRWKEPRHTCTPADKCPSSDHCGHPDLHPEEKKRKRDQRKDTPSDKEGKDTWKKRKKQERNSLLKVPRCPHFDDFYEQEMNKLVQENPGAYSLEKGSEEYSKATSLVVQKYKTLKTRLKQEKAVIRQIKMELKGLPPNIDQNEYIKKRKAELLAVGYQMIFPGINTTTTTTTSTTTTPIMPDVAGGGSSIASPSTLQMAPSAPSPIAPLAPATTAPVSVTIATSSPITTQPQAVPVSVPQSVNF